jgi:pilus assembly protein CpaB
MLRRQSLIALGIAVVLGILAVFLANTFLIAREKQVAVTPTGTTKVAVALVPLDYGMEVTPEKVRYVDYPTASLPPGTYRSQAHLLPMGKKRLALRPIQINQPILSADLTGEGKGASISALLPDGARAASVRINDVSGVAGFVKPYDSVDVLITRSVGGGESQGQVTDVLLQNIRVIAIDQNAKGGNPQPDLGKTATLQVTPLEAQKLALGQQVGALSLVLRKPGVEQDNPLVETVSLEDLRYSAYGGARYAGPVTAAVARPPVIVRPIVRRRPPPRRPATNSVEVTRGLTSSKYEVGGYGS